MNFNSQRESVSGRLFIYIFLKLLLIDFPSLSTVIKETNEIFNGRQHPNYRYIQNQDLESDLNQE